MKMFRIILLVFISTDTFLLSAVAQVCLTNGGPNPGKPCVFPFKFDGRTYYGCPPDLVEADKTWCSTKVDSAGKHVTGQDEFGFCSPNCPKQNCRTVSGPNPNADCVFPFKFEGKEYNYCPVDLEDPSKFWCSTKVDAAGNHVTKQGQFGHCSPDCPVEGGSSQPLTTLSSCPSGETCRPFVQCSPQVAPRDARSKLCSLPDNTNGVCCGDVTRLRGSTKILEQPKVAPRAGIPSDFAGLSNDIVLRSVDIGESTIRNITQRRSRINTVTGTRSPSFQHAMFQQPSPGVIERGRLCLIAMETARNLINEIDGNIGPGSISNSIDFDSANIRSSLLEKNCPPTPICNPRAKFRNVDGSCNNLIQPKFGMVFTPLQRLLPNDYADGLIEPRIAKSGRPLPSTRVVSNIAIAGNLVDESTFTTMLVGFGQFVDHDLDFVPISRNSEGEPIECCGEGGELLSVNPDPTLCEPIEVPLNDQFFRGSRGCINFVRSVCAISLDCQPGPIQQVNQITHWLDSSNVYGSTKEVADSVRAFRDGLLRTEPCENGEECLPFAAVSNCQGPTRRCALAGDMRVNEQPLLGVMHLLFVREHNRIARELKSINRQWNDERLYQESRRILNAEWQHIIYNEFLPVLLGQQFLENFNLIPLTRGFSNVYRSDFDPRIPNAFAAAAFRIGHTLIPSVIKMFRNRVLSGTFDLRDVFMNADTIRKGSNFDELLAGATIQPSESYDANFVDDVTNHLFDDNERGFDLVAINMQRGRDHGLPGYVKYREICGQGVANSFNDLLSNMSPQSVQKLQRAYDDVEDIDLFIGMTHERPCRQDALVGCTFLCIIGDTFARMRLGDRFFYDLPNQPGSFTESQLDQIRRVSLARIICDNSNLQAVSPLAFRQPDPITNPLTQCNSRLLLSGIPRVDLSVFRE